MLFVGLITLDRPPFYPPDHPIHSEIGGNSFKESYFAPPLTNRPPPLPDKHKLYFLIALAIQFTITIAISHLSARMMARPIEDLAKAAFDLSKNVNSPHLKEKGTIETVAAIRGFNHMQSKIAEQMQDRANYFAAISHDLRTPLTRLHLRLIRMELNDETQKIKQDVEEMSTLIESILNYFSVKSRAFPNQQIDIESLVSSVVDDVGELGYNISASGSADPITGNTQLLRRAINNLIDNGIRYGDKVDVNLLESDDIVSIHVRDSGPGIPEDQISQVKEPFYRIEKSRNKETGGYGLGLAIVEDIARYHGGSLQLSNHPSGGLVVVLSLPKSNQTLPKT